VVGGVSALFLDQLSGTNAASAAFTCGKAGVVDINSKMPRIGPYSEDQIRNAAIIITVGHEMKVPPRGWDYRRCYRDARE